ncbi:MAG: hypothetical protein WCA08_24040, partial [Desulfoferrobacter sp.]
ASNSGNSVADDSPGEQLPADNPGTAREHEHDASISAQEEAANRAQDRTEANLQQPADRPRPSETSPPIAGTPKPKPITRIVEKGDNLTRLIEEVYGVANDELISWVRENNPRLRNINTLFVGTEIVFPEYHGKAESRDEFPKH